MRKSALKITPLSYIVFRGCCRRFCNVLCCRKKKVQAAEARRSSIKPPPQEVRAAITLYQILIIYIIYIAECTSSSAYRFGRAELENERRHSGAAAALGLVLHLLQCCGAGSGHPLLRFLLYLHWNSSFLAIRQCQGSSGFVHHQHNCGRGSAILRALLLCRMGLVDLVGHYYA